MADTNGKVSEQTWFRGSLVVTIVVAAWFLNDKFARLDTRTAVLESNSTRANKTLDDIYSAMTRIADKTDGVAGRMENHEGRIAALEVWRSAEERKTNGK